LRRHTSYGTLQDEIKQMTTLSGLQCIIEAKNLNALIKGSLSCAISAQKFKIDMHPSSANKNKINLHQEVTRLFFTTKKNKY